MIYYNNNTINDWDFGSDNIAKVYYGVQGSQPRLPSGYTEVEYIQRDATHNGYVGLGEYFQENTKIEIDFQMTHADGYCTIGDYYNGSDDWRIFINHYKITNNYITYDFKGSRKYYVTSGWNQRFHIEIGNYYVKDLNSGNYWINSTPKTGFTRPNQMYIFNLETTETQQNTDYGHIYSLKIWQGDTLVKDFVPCFRNSDNVVGLYDIVGNEFHGSLESTLIAGSAVTPSSMSGRLVYQKITNGSTPPTPPLPYDAEIEYLESTGTQYINTNTYITDTSNFEVGYELVSGNTEEAHFGWAHQGVAKGAWVTVDLLHTVAYFGRYGNSSTDPTYKVIIPSSSISSVENTIVYKSNSGVTVNGTFYSKTLSLTTTDNITTVPLYFFVRYDFYKRGLEYPTNAKFKSFYLKQNDVLVLDMIPVRVGQVGYMYDKVSGQLFGNAGTGDFILGADK